MPKLRDRAAAASKIAGVIYPADLTVETGLPT